MSTYFALRRKDGVWMPDMKGKAGGTFVDPDKRRSNRGVPRLFTRPQDATSALKLWAKGQHHVIYYSDMDRESTREVRPVEGRNAADWSVVEVELKEVLDV